MKLPNFQHKVFRIATRGEFNAAAIELFLYQAKNNAVYQNFLKLLNVDPLQVKTTEDIPFLPIEVFKHHDVMTGEFDPEVIFTSSGTTSAATSRHLVRDASLYTESFTTGFNHFYGDPRDYRILALLPSYLERSGSSLVYMVEKLMQQSNHPENGFYLDDLKGLANKLNVAGDEGQKTLLIGVSYALLDLAEQFPQELPGTIIMETGGMKGRRKEITREELHNQLCSAFGVTEIHSEYGMTELLSQAYSSGNGIFRGPPWMQVMVREQDDPMKYCIGKTGGINVIDLANIDSCAFIATGDLGRVEEDGSFAVLGRFDFSDVRGCNLMVE